VMGSYCAQRKNVKHFFQHLCHNLNNLFVSTKKKFVLRGKGDIFAISKKIKFKTYLFLLQHPLQHFCDPQICFVTEWNVFDPQICFVTESNVDRHISENGQTNQQSKFYFKLGRCLEPQCLNKIRSKMLKYINAKKHLPVTEREKI
jgi:hypothetical protein